MSRSSLGCALVRQARWLAVSSLLACGGELDVLQVCREVGSCPPPSTQLTFAAQVLPSSKSTDGQTALLPQDHARLIFDAQGNNQLVLRNTVLLTGSVSDGSGQKLAGARLVARLESMAVGQNPYLLTSLTAEKPRGAFALRLPVAQEPSTQPYRLWVGFDDAYQASLAPPLLRTLVLTADSEQILSLKPLAELATVQGRVLGALGEGVSGLTVQAIDPEGQIVSSTALTTSGTGTGAGSYQIYIDPVLLRAGTATLRLVVRSTSTDPVLPTLEADLVAPAIGSTSRLDFAVPSYRKPAQFTLPLRGVAAGSLIAGARVRAVVALSDATTMKLGHRAYYVASGDSDGQGLVKLSLVPAPMGGSNLIYQISIASPARSSFASISQQDLPVGATEGLLGAVTLPRRAEVRGQLLNTDGQPMAGAQIIASRLRTDDLPSQAVQFLLPPDVPQVVTGDSGHFVLPLDAGDFDLDIVPISGAQARTSLDNVRVGIQDRDLGQLVLPAVTLGQTIVLGPSGQPVRDAKVRIFQLPNLTERPGLACSAAWPCSRTAKLRAEAITDANGLARYLLPGGSLQER